MQRTLFGILVILFLLTPESEAQTPDAAPLLKENYNGISFADFVQQVERTYQLRFFFDEEWVSGAVIEQTHTPASLLQILKETFAPLNLDPVVLYG